MNYSDYLDLDLLVDMTIPYDGILIPLYIDHMEFLLAGSEYQANTSAGLYIRDNLWTCRTSFIYKNSIMASSDIDEHSKEAVIKALETMQRKCYEDCNIILYHLIPDLPGLIMESLELDGRGHYLASYDGEERDVKELINYVKDDISASELILLPSRIMEEMNITSEELEEVLVYRVN